MRRAGEGVTRRQRGGGEGGDEGEGTHLTFGVTKLVEVQVAWDVRIPKCSVFQSTKYFEV